MKLKRSFFSRRRILALAAAVIVVAIAGLPLFEGTKSYPIAIVDGNSMYPALHNGDLVLFGAPPAVISNGSIIVFVQGGTGVGSLDSFLKPIVIHRVIGTGIEPNGMPYYQTKGDNNQALDPFVTDQSNVLGVPSLVVPFAGWPVLFLKTAFGMVALAALVTIFIVSGLETKVLDDEDKRRLLAVFATHSLNGELPPRAFERVKLAVEYYEDISTYDLKDPTMISAVDWLKKGALHGKWKEIRTLCPVCDSDAFMIVSGDNSFLVCPECGLARAPGS
ncbi:MAG: signal peptidase I [Thaumarchaeota archaeon]|nr:signal peptidase I [Nitrososphaerota archaeon]